MPRKLIKTATIRSVKEKNMNQEQRILRHLQENRGITQMEATSLYGILRLSGRIFDLRRQGYNIITTMIDVTNRYGEKCRVAEYRLCQN